MRTIRKIDRGGFGVVHEVADADGNRLAKKSFDPQLTETQDREKLRKRFAREVRIQSQIRHPNIMPILDHDLDASPPWFTMPLAGRTFREQIKRHHAACDFDPGPWQDILAAVEELHRLGYVHRDLKPENILLVDDVWVLSDFGLVLPTARETTMLTSSNSAYGSQFYAAPEQAQDFRNTPEQADVFALGCILHDAVEKNPARVPFAQIRGSGAYGAILEKCTEILPGRRFPTITSLRAALYDLWRTSEFPSADSSNESLLEAVQLDSGSQEAWRRLITALEESSTEELLRGIDADLICSLHTTDEVLFGRLIDILCAWASGTSFDFDYCDVVGDRLLEAYRLSTVRNQCTIVLAALELAIYHNRWHVMKQVGAMLAPTAKEGLVDRILIEIGLNSVIEGQLREIERIVHWRRDRWHQKIAVYLTSQDKHDDEGE